MMSNVFMSCHLDVISSVHNLFTLNCNLLNGSEDWRARHKWEDHNL